ncbi:MAG: outer membrane beta-barrel protein [Bacteroidia bacterium]
MKTLRKLNILIVTAFLSLFSFQSVAQEGFYLGAKFAPGISAIKSNTYNDSVKVETTIALGGGGLMGYQFNQHIATQLEVMYMASGQKYKAGTVDYHVRTNYLSMPLLLKLSTDINNPVSFNIQFGPQISFLMGTELETDNAGGGVQIEPEISIRPQDIGIAYGLGMDFNITSDSKLQGLFGFRGINGLVDINNKDERNPENPGVTENYIIIERATTSLYGIYLGLQYRF